MRLPYSFYFDKTILLSFQMKESLMPSPFTVSDTRKTTKPKVWRSDIPRSSYAEQMYFFKSDNTKHTHDKTVGCFNQMIGTKKYHMEILLLLVSLARSRYAQGAHSEDEFRKISRLFQDLRSEIRDTYRFLRFGERDPYTQLLFHVSEKRIFSPLPFNNNIPQPRSLTTGL